MTESLFHFDEDRPSFETLPDDQEVPYWWEHQLRDALGYETTQSFHGVIQKAIQACITLGIQHEDNFVLTTVLDGDQERREYRLTRFACYLTAMNADSRKEQVAAAQIYFATLAENFQEAIQDAESVDRLLIRDELTDANKQMNSTARKHQVSNYAFFVDAGYRGMYNLGAKALARRKGIPASKTMFDFMGKTELAANLFRLTQTEEKIRVQNIRGQKPLENAAETVGKKVRRTMIDIHGTQPEALPVAQPISQVKKDLRKTSRGFKKIDAPAKKRRARKSAS